MAEQLRSDVTMDLTDGRNAHCARVQREISRFETYGVKTKRFWLS